jgi:hypothetical protein
MGWKAANLLQEGQRVSSKNGEMLVVKSVAGKPYKKFTVFNFEVKNYHSYYVGANSVLVHNSSSKNIKSETSFSGLLEADFDIPWLTSERKTPKKTVIFSAYQGRTREPGVYEKYIKNSDGSLRLHGTIWAGHVSVGLPDGDLLLGGLPWGPIGSAKTKKLDPNFKQPTSVEESIQFMINENKRDPTSEASFPLVLSNDTNLHKWGAEGKYDAAYIDPKTGETKLGKTRVYRHEIGVTPDVVWRMEAMMAHARGAWRDPRYPLQPNKFLDYDVALAKGREIYVGNGVGTLEQEQHYRYFFPKHKDGVAAPGLDNVHNCATIFSICGLPLPGQSHLATYGKGQAPRLAQSMPEMGQMRPLMQILRRIAAEVDNRVRTNNFNVQL